MKLAKTWLITERLFECLRNATISNPIVTKPNTTSWANNKLMFPVYDGTQYHFMPWSRTKPTVILHSEWEDVEYRVGALNTLIWMKDFMVTTQFFFNCLMFYHVCHILLGIILLWKWYMFSQQTFIVNCFGAIILTHNRQKKWNSTTHWQKHML